MRTVSETLDTLLAAVHPITEAESIATEHANGRVLATTQIAQVNVPPMDNAQMDGYAVRAEECTQPSTLLPISQRITAGQVGQPLIPKTAARIFTGAMIPEGANAVVMQEHCTVHDQNIVIHHPPKSGEWIRPTGDDIRSGTMVLEQGTRLRAQELGLAASAGLATLPVIRPMRVAIFFTGNELTMPGVPLQPGAIYNANRFTLRGLLDNLHCDVTDYGTVPDSLAATQQALRDAAHHHDIIVTSGGVSVGEEDYVRPALEAEGTCHLWNIAMKPGKPFAFGRICHPKSTTPTFFLGLPGNPVASLVTFMLFVRPFILRAQGVRNVMPQPLLMRADFSWSKADQRNEFLRAKINTQGGLDLYPNQSSGVLHSAVWADGLVDNPPNQIIAPGDTVRFLSFNNLLY